jgi:hypothetical protein
MNEFFIGLHHPSTAWPFLNSMISVNRLVGRKKEFFKVNNWILDSGAFSQISKAGKFILSPDDYLKQIERYADVGNLLAAVCQDWMCESFILEKTGLSVEQHQELTLHSWIYLQQRCRVPILPVFQGFAPEDYVRHVGMYGEHLSYEAWVGVGSVCKRNGNPDAIEDVLLAIKQARPDLRLHGFGLKIQALERPTVRQLLETCDSMAWSFAGRKDTDANDPREALKYAAKVQAIIEKPVFVQEQLFKWWS